MGSSFLFVLLAVNFDHYASQNMTVPAQNQVFRFLASIPETLSHPELCRMYKRGGIWYPNSFYYSYSPLLAKTGAYLYRPEILKLHWLRQHVYVHWTAVLCIFCLLYMSVWRWE